MANPIAALDMYCWPENRSHWEALWAKIALNLKQQAIEAPDALTFAQDPWPVWQSPDLLLGHTCGWPFVSRLKQNVELVGLFDFALANCKPGHYNSVIIGRKKLLPDQTVRNLIFDAELAVAVNGLDSQSGFRAFREIVEGDPSERIPREQIVLSGSHRNSIIAVANGDADLAAIDAVTWEMAKCYEPAANDVHVIAKTQPVPGLPLITATGNHSVIPTLQTAVISALNTGLFGDDKPQPVGLVDVSAVDYDVLL